MTDNALIQIIESEIANRTDLTVSKTATGIEITGKDFIVKAVKRPVLGRGFRREVEMKKIEGTVKTGLSAEAFADFINRHTAQE